jgi:hypothetical protein
MTNRTLTACRTRCSQPAQTASSVTEATAPASAAADVQPQADQRVADADARRGGHPGQHDRGPRPVRGQVVAGDRGGQRDQAEPELLSEEVLLAVPPSHRLAGHTRGLISAGVGIGLMPAMARRLAPDPPVGWLHLDAPGPGYPVP